MKVDFGRYSDRGRSGQISAYRLVNGYVDKQGQGAKAPLPVMGVPGLVRWDNASYTGQCRGLQPVRAKGLYAVIGNSLAHFSSATSQSFVGAIAGSSSIGAGGGLGLVSMAANMATNPQIGIVTEDGLYYTVETSTDTITLYAGPGLPTPRSVDFLDRYFLFAIADGRFFHSGLDNAGNIDPLAFAFVESNPDGLVGVFGHRGAALALGDESMEVYEDLGSQPFAFSPVRSDINVGLGALHSFARCGDVSLWVDQDHDVRRMATADPESVGSDDLARHIADLSDDQRAGLVGNYYVFDRKHFYALTSALWTYELDLGTGQWHERQSDGRDNWLVQNIAKFNGKYICGSQADGKLYYPDPNAFDEDGGKLIMRAQSQTVHGFPFGGKCHKLTVDMVTGEGAADADDEIGLEISLDGGSNWIDCGTESFGRLGARNRRIQFRQLGQFDEKGITFALSASASILKTIIDVDAQITPLNR